MNIKKSFILPLCVYTYIALPFIIFAAGFFKWYLAIPVTAAVIFGVLCAAKSSEGLVEIPIKEHDITKIFVGVAFIILLVLLSGIGNIMWQNNDHATRNTLFDILVNFSWPPKFDAANGEVGLIYYIGFWLPSAIFGKLFSLDAGYIFQVVWASMALCIIWYLLCVMHKKVVLYPLFIFLFFSGLDIFGHSIISNLYDNLTTLQIGKWAFSKGSILTRHIEWWPRFFQYSSHITQLFWVFNQSLPVWVATLLIIVEKNNKNLVFIMGLTLLSSTLPFVGLIPVFFWCAFCSHDGEDYLNRHFTSNFKSSFLSLFSYQNFVGGGLSGILSFIYLIGNIASSQGSSQIASGSQSGSAANFSPIVFIAVMGIWLCVYSFMLSGGETKALHVLYLAPSIPLAYLLAKLPDYKISYYIFFIIFEFLILTLILRPAHKSSTLFFITVAALLIIPFFVVGKSIDFCMRASIPLLAVLALFAIDALKKYFDSDKQLLATLLCTVLMLGALTPAREIIRTIEATRYEIDTKGEVKNDSKTINQVFGVRNFTGKTKNNVFFEYIAK